MNGTPVYAGFPPSGWVPTIAGALADLRGFAIGMAAAFVILLSMRGTL